ncbi:MAG TPA: PhaM family polyhydroxyalkanoate granule multifunctional regulatory protein [Rubrivivax sp.]
MQGAGDFAKMVPGFDFLQGLMKNASGALPNMGQWIAPTLDPDALDKRIEELRTVHFWLEQNARMLAATIQALEVQRMTLSTLKTMNMPVTDIANAFMLKTPAAEPPRPAPAPAPEAEPEPEPEAAAPAETPPAAKPARRAATQATAPAAAMPGVVDPVQWWGALTQQFTQLAANAIKDGPSGAAKNLAGDMVKQSFEAANKTLQKVGGKTAAKKPARKPAKAAGAAPAKRRR